VSGRDPRHPIRVAAWFPPPVRRYPLAFGASVGIMAPVVVPPEPVTHDADVGADHALAVPGLPAGLTVRRPAAADAAALVDLCARDEAAVVGHPVTPIGEVLEMLAPAHTRPDADQWLVLDAAGLPVVWGLISDAGNTAHQDVCVFRDGGRVDEQVRRLVLDRLLARTAERARERGYQRVELGAGCFPADQAYAATLRAAGFQHGRTFHWMLIDLEPAPPVTVDVPAGVRIAPLDPDDEQQWRDVHAVLQASFADHWGSVPVAYQDFRAEVDAEPHADLPLWRLAWLDGHVVGVSRASGRHQDEGGGWVAQLGVLPHARGRGIARALLQASFEANRAAGRTSVGLGVDSENSTGAVRLYESVGMHLTQQVHAYTRDVLSA